MGLWKKFCLNLTTVALPSLIAKDLVIVKPMTSMSGYITYIKYTTGSNKGGVHQGDVFNTPFAIGKVDSSYTSSKIVEECSVADDKCSILWTPVAEVKKVEAVTGSMEGVTYVVDKASGLITFTAGSSATVPTKVKVAYEYDNISVPQNDLPIINAEVASIALVAKARRVAIYYSQIAAFQAKTDYGFDLGDQLAEQACGRLAYEIDCEICDLLIANAAVDNDLKFNKELPYGVSKAEHYEGFSELLEIGRQKVYDKTQKYAPNYMIIASNILPILGFIKGWKAAPAGKIAGPYFAGTLNGVKVYVTPNIAPGKFVLGVNGDDMMSSAAVYAPYMAVVPTQLLGYADGGMSEGFSTLYALEMLNADLLVAGSVVSEPRTVLTDNLGD